MPKISAKQMGGAMVMAGNLLLRRYPRFVYGNAASPDEIPTFCFHGVTADYLEKVLQYLGENKYHTLSMEEFFGIVTGHLKPRERSVLLTFDDGTGSMWSVAYPLFRKYNMRATLFAIPGRISTQKRRAPNLEDVWQKRASMEDIAHRDAGSEPLATWEELKIMHDSGLFDIESHSFSHSLIYTGPKIVDFVRPEILASFHDFEFPQKYSGGNSVELIDLKNLGQPIYESAPRLSARRRYIDDEELSRRCIQLVEENGGDQFFAHHGWRERLLEITGSIRGRTPEFETAKERDSAVLHELKRSKEMLESNLPGKEVHHLCYPWGIGSELSLNMARDVGYRTNFWDRIDNKLTITVGQDPFRLNRIGSDFFYCLPGKGRKSLVQVLQSKYAKRMRRGSPFLSH